MGNRSSDVFRSHVWMRFPTRDSRFVVVILDSWSLGYSHSPGFNDRKTAAQPVAQFRDRFDDGRGLGAACTTVKFDEDDTSGRA